MVCGQSAKYVGSPWVGMQGASHLDNRGRITIERPLRPHLGRRVIQVLTPHGVLLRPVGDTLASKGLLPDALTASGEDAAAAEAGQ